MRRVINQVEISSFAAVQILILAGCVTAPPSPVGHWESRTRLTGAVHLSVSSFRNEALDDHRSIIRGQISDCSYDRELLRDWVGEGRKAPELIRRERVQWVPDRARVRTVFGEQTIYPNRDGSFEILLDGSTLHEYFAKPPDKEDYRVDYRIRSIELKPLSAPGSLEYEWEEIGEFPVWFYSYEPAESSFDLERAIGDFQSKNVATVILRFERFSSRSPITPIVVISYVSGPEEAELVNRAEADGIPRSRSEIVVRGTNFFGVDDELRESSQTIIFRGIVGATYLIEASQGESFFFASPLTVLKAGTIDKKVLLMEKGETIRVQESNEGEGGVLIDNL